MSSDRTCTTCGGPLPDDIPEGAPCPGCAQADADRTVLLPAPAGSPIPAQIRQTVGDYEVLDKLGQGGMGAVYRARQISLDRIVALKVLPAQFGDDPDYIGRFQREARVASGLRHPNLVGVYACGSADGCHFIAMELIEGENLHQRLRQGPMDVAEALSVTDYVARGLQCGWETAQVVHRDIKPSNIYLSYEGDVKVGDLGLAKSLSSNTTGLTQTGSMMGTPHYMSPEQCRGDKVIDFRADIYSLGCTLFEMLTGKPPYPGNDPIAIVRQHLDSPPAGLLKAMPDCPLPLALLVGRMLKKAPRERHASYAELIAEIESLYQQVESGTLVRGAGFGATAKTPPPRTTRESPNWIPSAIMGVIIIALCVIFIPNWKTNPPAQEEDADILATPKALPPSAVTPRASPIAAATPTPAPAPVIASTVGAWRPLFAADKWKPPTHLIDNSLFRLEPVTDRAIQARIRWRDGSVGVGLLARGTREEGSYHLKLQTSSTVQLAYFPTGSRGENSIVLGTHDLPKPIQPGDTPVLELRLQGDRLTALVDGAVVIEARDSRLPGPGVWGIVAGDGWYESVEVQTPLPAAANLPPSDGWEDLRTPLTPAVLEKTGGGWRLEGQALRSPNYAFGRLPLGTFAGTSYQVRVNLRQLIPKDGFNILLPVGDRSVGFTLNGAPAEGYFTGLNQVNGKRGKDLPGSVFGRQVQDSEPHELEVTVRLDGANATISSTLDARPLYAWTGPIAALSVRWPELPWSPDTLALLTFADDWLVLEVKAKRLEGK